jgi:predicted AAA+ superfamily ATPase
MAQLRINKYNCPCNEIPVLCSYMSITGIKTIILYLSVLQTSFVNIQTIIWSIKKKKTSCQYQVPQSFYIYTPMFQSREQVDSSMIHFKLLWHISHETFPGNGAYIFKNFHFVFYSKIGVAVLVVIVW